jgi:hypothetical protein
MTTKTHRTFAATLALTTLLLTGIYSCNNNASTEEKKADTSSMSAPDTSKMMMPADTTNPSDTGREIKVPKP